MDINLLVVTLCATISMVVGFIWYGPLFGKKWIEIIGATEMDISARKEMQKRAMPLYVISFLMTFLQVYFLALYIENWQSISGITNALLIWGAFIVPTVAAGSMWNNDSAKISWARFLIQAGYYLVLFVIFGFILSIWG